MMPLRVLVLTTSACLIGAKFLDCYSTMSQLEKPEDELNPLGRAAINRVGKRAAIWGVFLLVVIIVAIVGGTAYRQALGLLEDREPNFIEVITVWAYVILGLAIAGVQAAVAHTNWTGRYSLISRSVAGVYRWLGSWVQG